MYSSKQCNNLMQKVTNTCLPTNDYNVDSMLFLASSHKNECSYNYLNEL